MLHNINFYLYPLHGKHEMGLISEKKVSAESFLGIWEINETLLSLLSQIDSAASRQKVLKSFKRKG
jgi:hypothetical protein